MDVRNSRGRIFSILNDNDCPSFVIRHSHTSPFPPKHAPPSLSPRQERPNFLRQTQYSKRNLSFSSAGSASSPPLLRYDSSSSKSSSGSMESSPSPITPAYAYNDTNFIPYDQLLRQDLTGYLPSPTSITPFMEQQLMIAPAMPDHLSHFSTKSMSARAPSQYPLIPAPSLEGRQMLTPAPSLQSASMSTSTTSASTKPSPQNASNGASGKKNKYPCPYAASHHCSATFTTSGHAARHGKKHTGEKGVHCPICNKAFTRKDNMKQHERTHKGSSAGSTSDEQPARRNKAAITKDALKANAAQADLQGADATRRPSTVQSPLSEVTSLGAGAIGTPMNLEEPVLYPNPPPQMMLSAGQPTPAPMSLYPPLGDDTMLNAGPAMAQPFDTKLSMLSDLAPPGLTRGYSDLDALAQAAAESYDPYYQPKY